jgi:hypothetical protein
MLDGGLPTPEFLASVEADRVSRLIGVVSVVHESVAASTAGRSQRRTGAVHEQLQQALVSRPVIDQALGIIMSGHKVDAAAAAPPMVASLVAPGRRLPDGHDDLTVPHHRRTPRRRWDPASATLGIGVHSGDEHSASP